MSDQHILLSHLNLPEEVVSGPVVYSFDWTTDTCYILSSVSSLNPRSPFFPPIPRNARVVTDSYGIVFVGAYHFISHSDRSFECYVHGYSVFELKRNRTLFGGLDDITRRAVFQFLHEKPIAVTKKRDKI